MIVNGSDVRVESVVTVGEVWWIRVFNRSNGRVLSAEGRGKAQMMRRQKMLIHQLTRTDDSAPSLEAQRTAPGEPEYHH